MIHSKDERLEAFSRLLDVLDNLRTHCPWDRKQTNESLRANTIEEVYELSEALEQGDTNAISKEPVSYTHLDVYKRQVYPQGKTENRGGEFDPLASDSGADTRPLHEGAEQRLSLIHIYDESHPDSSSKH